MYGCVFVYIKIHAIKQACQLRAQRGAHANQRLHTHIHLPADESPADCHLFTLVHDSSPRLAVHHSILVPSPGLAPALNPTTQTFQSVLL